MWDLTDIYGKVLSRHSQTLLSGAQSQDTAQWSKAEAKEITPEHKKDLFYSKHG